MFDLGWAELLIIAVVALVVVGPKDLPAALRTVTGLMRQARSMARDFQRGIEDMARESGIDEIKRDIKESVDLDLEDDIRDALGSGFDDDKPSLASGNSIMNPETAKTLAKKPSTGQEAETAPANAPPASEPTPGGQAAETTSGAAPEPAPGTAQGTTT